MKLEIKNENDTESREIFVVQNEVFEDEQVQALKVGLHY